VRTILVRKQGGDLFAAWGRGSSSGTSAIPGTKEPYDQEKDERTGGTELGQENANLTETIQGHIVRKRRGNKKRAERSKERLGYPAEGQGWRSATG